MPRGEPRASMLRSPKPPAGSRISLPVEEHLVSPARVGLAGEREGGVDAQSPGNVADLKRHLLCVNRTEGRILWNKVVAAKMPRESPPSNSLGRKWRCSTRPRRWSMTAG
jgi:hypothetical protein